MRGAWRRLSLRERRTAALGLGLALVLLAYFAVWQPGQRRLHALRADVAELAADLAWMQATAAEVKRLQQASPTSTARPAQAQSLLTLIDTTARSAGLDAAVKRVEPRADGGLALHLEGAPFDGVVHWLAALDREHGVSVADAVLERAAPVGRVNALLVLRGAAR